MQVVEFIVGRHDNFVLLLEQWQTFRDHGSESSVSKYLPTLFGNSDVKTELCSLVYHYLFGNQHVL